MPQPVGARTAHQDERTDPKGTAQDSRWSETETRHEKEAKETEMRYENQDDLPATLTHVLPDDAQKVYLETYNRAWDDYDQETTDDMSRHSVAHRQAWATIEQVFERHPNSGNWQRKDEQPAEYHARNFLDNVKDAIARVLS
jgi:cation transport regulator ChaB